MKRFRLVSVAGSLLLSRATVSSARQRQIPATSLTIALRCEFIIPLALILAGFALSPRARAVDPPPDGGYPNQNTAEGENALFSLTSGLDNTAIGFDALYSNTTGFTNTATGESALHNNTTGFENTANGAFALLNNTTGAGNTANGGYAALFNNTTGSGNIALGHSAGYNLTTGVTISISATSRLQPNQASSALERMESKPGPTSRVS